MYVMVRSGNIPRLMIKRLSKEGAAPGEGVRSHPLLHP